MGNQEKGGKEHWLTSKFVFCFTNYRTRLHGVERDACVVHINWAALILVGIGPVCCHRSDPWVKEVLELWHIENCLRIWRIHCVDVNNPIGTIHHIQSFGGHASGSHLKGMYKFPHGKVGLHKLEYALTKCPKCTKSTLSEGASLTLSIGGRWAQRSKNLTIGNGSVWSEPRTVA